MSDESLVRLSGSERAPLASAVPAGQLDPSERAELTLVLRRRAALPADVDGGFVAMLQDELLVMGRPSQQHAAATGGTGPLFGTGLRAAVEDHLVS